MIIPAQTSVFNENFVRYLKSIGIDNPSLLKRCKLIFALCDRMTRETINDIFVTDGGSADSLREHDNLWCFTNNYAIEAKKFLTEVRLEIIPIGQRISNWAVTAVDYEFGEVNPGSKLSLGFTTQGMTRELKAAGANCKHFSTIIENYIKPNMPFG